MKHTALLVMLLAATPAVAQTAADSAANRATALDYIEGFYEANPERMERALHPDLAKRIVRTRGDESMVMNMTAEQLVDIAGSHAGNPTPESERRSDVMITNIYRNAATVRIDATTWVDPTVIQWVAANAVAVQLDMDVHESVKTTLGIKAFPTMVLLRPDGTEFDRVVGLRTPDEMMTWLRGAESGTREIDRVRAQMKEVAAQPSGNLSARMGLASAAASLGAREEAEEFVLWLWSHEPADDSDKLYLSSWRNGQGRCVASP